MNIFYRGVFVLISCVLFSLSTYGQFVSIQAHASPDTVCPGQQTMLWATATPICGPSSNPCQGQSSIKQVGTGAVQQASGTLYPSPYGNFRNSARHQYLFHANELLPVFGSGGQINSIGMYIGIAGSGSVLDNFTIRMGCIPPLDSLTGYVTDSLTTVYTTNYNPGSGTGWKTHILTTPYYWDGVSDLIVDVCFYNPNTNSNINPGMLCTTTPFRSVWCTYSDVVGGVCDIPGTQQAPVPVYATYFERPNFQFSVCIPQLPDSDLTWTPNTGANGVTIIHTDTTYANPLNQTTYTVTMVQNGDTSTSSVIVYMDTTVQLKVTPDTLSECSASAVQLQANVSIQAGSGVNPNTLVYTWTAIPATSPTPPSGTGPGFASGTVTPTVNTIYICKVTGPGVNCTLIDTANIKIGNGLVVPATVDSISCATSNNGKIFINMSSGTAPYIYTWNPVGPNVDSLTNLGPGTYYLTVTDAGGCIGHDTFKLTAPAPLTLTMDSANILCYDVDIDTIKAIVTGGRGPYTYTWNPAEANTNKLTGLPAGDYDLTVTDASGCTISDAVNITQPTQLVSSATSTNYTSFNAHNGTITVTTSGGTPGYTYSSVPNAPGLPNAIGLDTGTYIITVCDLHHCCVNDTVHISEPPPIDITFVVVNNLCFGQCNGTATVTASGGVLPYTYQWNTVPPTVVLGTGTEITGLCAGTYQVIVTDANGVPVPKDTIITAPTALGEKIDSTTITCFNADNGTLKDSAYGGTPPYSYTWTPGGNANPLTNLGPGMYIVNVTDANGCPEVDTGFLGQPTQVTAVVISTDSVTCFGGTNGYANVQAGGGRPPYTYVWSGSSSVDSFASDLSAGTQTITVKDASGCTATATFTIYQPTQLVISAVDTTPAHCAQSHDGSAIAVVTGGSPAYTYSWDGTSTGNVDSIQGLASGTHTLSVTDSKGCSTSVSFLINTQYTLAISLTSDSVTCHGYSNGAAYATPLNGFPNYTYQWNPSTSTVDSATGLSAGVQSVTVTDIYGCTANGSVMVGQPIPIIVTDSFSDPLCTGQSNGKVWINASGTIAPYTYTFNGGATVYPIADPVTGLAAGVYTFIVTDGRSCTQSGTVTLTDPTKLTLPPPTVTGISCANEANGIIQLNPTGGTPPYTYAWSPGGYTASQEDSLGPANYTIIVTDANGCTATASDSLSAPPLICASFIVDSTSCPGSADGHIIVNAFGGTPGNPITYTYSLDGVNYQIGNNFFSLLAGTYTIYVKDSPGCILDTFTTVYQPSAITAIINPQDSMIPLGGSIQLFSLIGNLTTQTVNSYAWSPELGLSCIDCPNPVASPYVSTEYYLTVNYGKGCIVIDSDLIQVGPHAPVYIPNAFTPNGDGIDDYFSVFGTTLYGVGMKIFNRWGEKVFDSGSTQWASWDGTFKGVLQLPGVYVYYVQLVFIDGSQETREGSITLIR